MWAGSTCNLVSDKDSVSRNNSVFNYFVKFVETPVQTREPDVSTTPPATPAPAGGTYSAVTVPAACSNYAAVSSTDPAEIIITHNPGTGSSFEGRVRIFWTNSRSIAPEQIIVRIWNRLYYLPHNGFR